MTDDDHAHEESDHGIERTTAPQAPYAGRHVAIGTVVALVGLLVVFGVPLLLA